MTAINVTITNPGSYPEGNYSSGMVNAKPCTGQCTIQLSPVTDGNSTPPSNATTVFASTYGGELDILPVNGTPAGDGSQTKIVYWESLDDTTQRRTGHQKISLRSKATVVINQLQSGRYNTLAAAGSSFPTLSPGLAVQSQGGTWVDLEDAGSPVSIEAAANSLIWIDGAAWDGNLTLTIDLSRGSAGAITDKVLNGVPCAFIQDSATIGWGVAVAGITAAALTAKRTITNIWGSVYWVFN